MIKNDFIGAIASLIVENQSRSGIQNHPEFGTISNIKDPLKLNRIKITTEIKGGKTESDFQMRMLPFPFFDPPMPFLGMSAVSASFNGNPHDRVWMGCLVNDGNPPLPKKNPLDLWWLIPNDSTVQIAGKSLLQVEKESLMQFTDNFGLDIGKDSRVGVSGEWSEEIGDDFTAIHRKNHKWDVVGWFKQTVKRSLHIKARSMIFESETEIVFKNTAGAKVRLLPTGHIVFEDKWGNKMMMGSSGIGWNLGGRPLRITNTSSVSIRGRQIATVRAIDSRGHRIVYRGW